MKSAEDDLLSYVKERSSAPFFDLDGRYLLSNLELHVILGNRLKKLHGHGSGPLNALIMNMMARQKKQNQIVESELQLLTAASERAGIKLVCLKGLFLASELYEPKESRQFNDVDVLIEAKDMGLCIDVLEKLGYEDKENARGWFENRRSNIHQFTFEKELQDSQAQVSVELHIHLAGPPWDRNIDISSLIDRSVGAPLYGGWILEIHDRLLYLVVHFVKHYLTSCLLTLQRANRPAFPRLRMLHDIALLVDKYEQRIDWETILRRADEWGICSEALFVFQVINHMYPDRVPLECVESLVQRPAFSARKSMFVNGVLGALIDEGPESVLNGVSYDLINKAISSVGTRPGTRAPEIKCPFLRRKDDASGFLGSFVINETPDTTVVGPKDIGRDEKRADCSVVGRLLWDELKLYCRFRVYDDNLVFESGPGSFWDQDSVEFVFYDVESRPGWCHLILVPRMEQGKLDLPLVMITGPHYRYLESDLYEYEAALCKGGYKVVLAIPWSAIGIEPRIGKQIMLEIMVNVCDDATQGRNYQLMWSGGDSVLYLDPTIFGRVVLV